MNNIEQQKMHPYFCPKVWTYWFWTMNEFCWWQLRFKIFPNFLRLYINHPNCRTPKNQNNKLLSLILKWFQYLKNNSVYYQYFRADLKHIFSPSQAIFSSPSRRMKLWWSFYDFLNRVYHYEYSMVSKYHVYYRRYWQ